MTTPRRFTHLGFAMLALHSAVAAPAWSQCPAEKEPAQIEVLVDDFHDEGDTCDFRNTISSYNSISSDHPSCTIPEAPFPGPDAIYKIWLHDGNEVAFHLDVIEDDPIKPDLVLALIQPCANNRCVRNSTDFISSQDEEISRASYTPGIYYLVVDSAEDALCGKYKLTVTGVNPTPDLGLDLADSPDPVIAGEDLTYTLTVTNRPSPHGPLAATGVEITQTLPEGVQFVSASPNFCTASGQTVLCRIGDLAVGAPPQSVKVTVHVSPTRGELNQAGQYVLASTASVKAHEGDPTPDDNSVPVTTRVIAKSDLSIEKPPRDSVVAGTSYSYKLTVHNAGPSDATQVKLTDELLEGNATLSTRSRGCKGDGRIVTCIIPRIKVGQTVESLITVDVAPSAAAGSSLVNRATVSTTARDASDPNDENDRRDVTTEVDRKTDLEIRKSGATDVIAGDELTYKITVFNHGPSESSGGTVTDELPAGLTFKRSLDGCEDDNHDGTVTCDIHGIIDRNPGRSVRFVVDVASSLRSGTIISNRARVTAKETDQGPDNNTSKAADTRVKVEADLELTAKRAKAVSKLGLNLTESVIAGENLLYELEVRNNGPSDSQGGTISDPLSPALMFVASPDGCRGEDGIVRCPVPVLENGKSVIRRFVVKVNPSATVSISNQACVHSAVPEDDKDGDNDCGDPISTAVTPAADLAVSLSDSPDAVVIVSDLAYTLDVINHGPSDAEGVTVQLKLPPGGSFVSASETNCYQVTDGQDHFVRCDDLGALPAGAAKTLAVHTLAPGDRGTAKATASVSADTTDPSLDNNEDDATTTVASAIDSDLAVTKKAAVEAVVAGDLLHYTIEVANHGPSKGDEVRVQDTLPPGVTFQPEPSLTECSGTQDIICDLGTLQINQERRLTLTVEVLPGAESPLENSATVSSTSPDPNPENNRSSAVKTPVLEAPPLVLPFFAVDHSAGIKTLFAVKNRSDSPVCVQYEDIPAATQPEYSCIAKKAIGTKSLDTGVAVGHVGISPVEDCDNCVGCGGCEVPDPRDLSGDFIRFHSATGPASGELLVSTDTSRLPPELCRRWSVRFLNDKTLASSTELLFFVPGNSPSKGLIAEGKVYTEPGQFVQEVSITESAEAFRKTTADKFDHGVDLLANFGAIEWEFPEGVIGNVSAVYKAGNLAVAVPGFCRDGDRSSAAPLIVPFFEVDRGNPSGATTLFAVRNETDATADIVYKYLSAGGAVLREEPSSLASHATRTVNLRDVQLPGTGLLTGFVQIEPTAGGTFSGDFVLFDPSRDAAGGALVDTNRDRRSPAQLCQLWDVRFLQGEPSGASTEFFFYIQSNTGAMVKGRAYSETGAPVKDGISVPISARSRRVPASSLGLPEQAKSGSIEWDLGDGVAGNVSAVFTGNGGVSVLVPGVCRDKDP